MYLSNIKLWNYRKFGAGGEIDLAKPNLDLNLTKGLNVIIGENDSGKTAIIDAVKLVLKTHSYNYIRVDDKDFYKVFLTGLKSVRNLFQSGFFISTFSRAKSYFIFKLLSEPEILNIQAMLFDAENINFKELINLEKKHPLNDNFIDLSFLNSSTSL